MNVGVSGTGFTIQHFLFCVAVGLAAYGTMAVLPAFNADDIIQAQPYSGDSGSFLASGRWGYHLIYKTLFGTNPAGPFALVLGVVLLTSASWLATLVIGLTRTMAVIAFVLLSTISLYWGNVLSFDSTRVAYPLATLLAIGGLHMMLNGRWAWGVLVFAIATSLYQPSVQVAASILIGAAVLSVASGSREVTIRKFASGVLGMLAGAALYYALTLASPHLTGVPLSGRSDIDIVSALARYQRLIDIFLGHSLPNGYGMPYFSPLMKASVMALMAGYVIGVAIFARDKRPTTLLTASALSVLLLVAPFSLALASPSDAFGPRALIAYASVHAVFAAVPMELAAERTKCSRANRIGTAYGALAAVFLTVIAIQISSLAFDDYLVSRNDILATNRIIARVDEVIAQSSIPAAGPIPILVRHDTAVAMAPRGTVESARHVSWSREWIFRHIDPRFVPVGSNTREAILEDAEDGPIWPAPGSVYVVSGTVVVLID